MSHSQSTAALADLTDADLVAVARATPIHPDACRFIPTGWLRAAIAADRALNAPYIAALEADAAKYRNIGAPIAPEHAEELQRLADEAVRRHHQDMAYAARYAWLRERDLDSIGAGGLFVGRTPDNVVINGDDLDAAVDAARAGG